MLVGMIVIFEGTVKLIFQPEEKLIQGAKKMLEEGVLEGVNAILAIHIWSQLNSGKISLESGPRLAAGDRFEITVKGKGSHGAIPHMGIDTIVVASAKVLIKNIFLVSSGCSLIE